MEWKDIITAAIAAYAALLSTYTAYSQRREKKSLIDVSITISMLVRGRNVSDPVVMLTASNPGQKAVTLCGEGFILPNGKTVVFPYQNTNVQFPYDLTPEKNCQVWMDTKQLALVLQGEGYYGEVNLIGFYHDQVGKTHKSKKWKFNTYVWAS
jgi:hypothetical protein